VFSPNPLSPVSDTGIESLLKFYIVLVNVTPFSVKNPFFFCADDINSIECSYKKKTKYSSFRKLGCIMSAEYDNLAELRQSLTSMAIHDS